MIIGITGKNGSGKSKAARIISDALGIPVCDFDLIWEEVLKSPDISKRLVSCLNDSILDTNGVVSIKKLSKVIFAAGNEGLRANHNTITMPAVLKKVEEAIQKNNGNGILDFKLLPLTQFWSQCDFRILIEAKDKIRMQRMLNRDAIDRKVLQKRDASSPPIVLAPPGINYVIENNGTEQELIQACNSCVKEIKQTKNNDTKSQ